MLARRRHVCSRGARAQADECEVQLKLEVSALRDELVRAEGQLETLRASLAEEKAKKIALQQWKNAKQGLLAQVRGCVHAATVSC